ncbi:MAG: AMP-binding protein [Clostridia bacterium]|nr:AMP-binding protein [Clostridia bacterium]
MTTTYEKLFEVAKRIKEMREIMGFSVEEMAEKTEVTADEYVKLESGKEDFPFTFIHKCALAFNLEINDILEGVSANLSSYNVTRKGKGQQTAKEEGITISNLAPMFKHKIAEPYYVTYEYSEEQQNHPIHCTTHKGQEFDLVLEGSLKVQVGDNTVVLNEGDSIYYNSSTPHGMIAMGGKKCTFCAVVLPGDGTNDEKEITGTIVSARQSENLLINKFAKPIENEDGSLKSISFENEDNFNFAFDVVDAIAKKYPDKLAMIHVADDKTETRFTFKEMKDASSQVANYFKSLGIERGDRVMLVLKRNYQFWFSILALHKLGAIAIPATNMLKEHDYTYRFNAASVKAIICSDDEYILEQVELAERESTTLKIKVAATADREGWHNMSKEYPLFSRKFTREEDAPCGDDPMLMFFTSGTTGYPKIAEHSYKYPLGHFVTAKYWHCVERDGLHLTIADTGWGKALWGKLYGQWMCEGAVFVYDFERFNAADILPMFKKYNITTFCAPPTMYRMLIKEDLANYDLSSLHHVTIAGEALNPEVFKQFKKATGLSLMEGFGQTETTLTIANLVGMTPKPGSMGKPVSPYNIDIVNPDGESCEIGESGEIVVRIDKDTPCGLFMGYYLNEDKTKEVMYDGLYHTGDVAWKDEDGYFWYVGRTDDVIKSSGYRIGPFEIENVIMELPYVLECGVSAEPDEIRGQIVKASIVLTKGTEPTEELKKEIQSYVKEKTAPYKYPRIVVFKEELPKTISGKIQRNKL